MPRFSRRVKIHKHDLHKNYFSGLGNLGRIIERSYGFSSLRVLKYYRVITLVSKILHRTDRQTDMWTVYYYLQDKYETITNFIHF